LQIDTLCVNSQFTAANLRNLLNMPSCTVAHWRWLRYMAKTCRSSKHLCCAVGWNWICLYPFLYW